MSAQTPRPGLRCFIVQVPPSKKGHVDRLRAEEKWQSRVRLTETSFSFLESQKEASASASASLQSDGMEEVEDWHFERPRVSTPGLYIYISHFLISVNNLYVNILRFHVYTIVLNYCGFVFVL